MASIRWVRPDLDDVRELSAFACSGRAKAFKGGQQILSDSRHGRGMDGARNHVVGRLAVVDLSLGWTVRIRSQPHRDLACPTGDDLVGVGVGRSTGTGLEDVEHELLVEPAVDDLVGGHPDRVRVVLVEMVLERRNAGWRVSGVDRLGRCGARRRLGRRGVGGGILGHGLTVPRFARGAVACFGAATTSVESRSTSRRESLRRRAQGKCSCRTLAKTSSTVLESP